LLELGIPHILRLVVAANTAAGISELKGSETY